MKGRLEAELSPQQAGFKEAQVAISWTSITSLKNAHSMITHRSCASLTTQKHLIWSDMTIFSKASYWANCRSLTPTDHAANSEWVFYWARCILSPSLFNTCTEFITRQGLEGFGKVEGARIFIGGPLLINLRSCDDTMLFATTTNAVQQMLGSAKTTNEEYRLFLLTTKTKCMNVKHS